MGIIHGPTGNHIVLGIDKRTSTQINPKGSPNLANTNSCVLHALSETSSFRRFSGLSPTSKTSIYIYVYILVVNLRSLDRNRSRPRGDVRRFACRVLALEEQLDSLMKQKTGIEEEIKALTSSGDGEDSWARGAEKLQQKVDEEILGSLSPA